MTNKWFIKLKDYCETHSKRRRNMISCLRNHLAGNRNMISMEVALCSPDLKPGGTRFWNHHINTQRGFYVVSRSRVSWEFALCCTAGFPLPPTGTGSPEAKKKDLFVLRHFPHTSWNRAFHVWMFCRIVRMQPLSRIFNKFCWNTQSSAIKGDFFFKQDGKGCAKFPAMFLAVY